MTKTVPVVTGRVGVEQASTTSMLFDTDEGDRRSDHIFYFRLGFFCQYVSIQILLFLFLTDCLVIAFAFALSVAQRAQQASLKSSYF